MLSKLETLEAFKLEQQMKIDFIKRLQATIDADIPFEYNV